MIIFKNTSEDVFAILVTVLVNVLKWAADVINPKIHQCLEVNAIFFFSIYVNFFDNKWTLYNIYILYR